MYVTINNNSNTLG